MGLNKVNFKDYCHKSSVLERTFYVTKTKQCRKKNVYVFLVLQGPGPFLFRGLISLPKD